MRTTIAAAGALAVIFASVLCAVYIPVDEGRGEPLGGTAGPLSWNITDGFTLVISGEGALPSYSSSAAPWAEYHETVTSIVVGEGVTKLGVSAFAGMDHVVSVELPDTLTLIDNSCFAGCTSLESIVIPDSVTSPGRNTFQNCTSLRTAVVGDGAKWIGQYCFDGCTALESVSIGSSVLTLGNYTFQNCTSLAEIGIPEGVTSFGYYCFAGCTSLTHVDLPSTLTEMQTGSFSGSGLTEIVIPDTCNEVWRYSFRDCTSLTYVKYPDTITYVGAENFKGCTALETFIFGNSVVEIRENAFNGCSSLTECWLPESLETVGNNAFKGCSSLTEAIFYENVTSVGNYAYQGCNALAEVTFGSSVSAIGTGAFNGCSNLATINNASDLVIAPKSTDYGYVARYADSVVSVEPYSAVYRDAESNISSQTVYGSDGTVSFRIRPADPSKENYGFLGWTDGSGTYARYDRVTLPDDGIVLEATWALLEFTVEVDEQYAVSGAEITFAVEVLEEGEYTYTVDSVSAGTATIDSEGNVTCTCPAAEGLTDIMIEISVFNGAGTEVANVLVHVRPVLTFTNTPEEGEVAA